MTTVTEALLGSVSASEVGLKPADVAERIDGWLHRGRLAWPEIDLEGYEVEFVRHIGALVATSETPLEEAESRLLEDLYLAFACGQQRPGALRCFERDLGAVLELPHATWRGPEVDVDDFRQSVRERLFVGEPPKILSYEGRGPLRAWVKMVAIRRLTDLSAAASRHRSRSGDDEVLVSRMMPARELSAHLIQNEYRSRVQSAIESALRGLSPAQRILLRQRFVFGLTLIELAQLNGVHRVTISKRLAKARREAVDSMSAELAAHVGTDRDAQSIARLCASQLEISLGQLLDSGSGSSEGSED